MTLHGPAADRREPQPGRARRLELELRRHPECLPAPCLTVRRGKDLEFRSITRFTARRGPVHERSGGRKQARPVGGCVNRWRPSQELVVLATYSVGLYMVAVDNTIIFTALPSVARDFHVSLASAQWVTLSYLLTLAMMVPCSGWIGDRFGTRRAFLIALALFTGASALCGLSGSLTEVVLFRVLQGVGGGLIIPVGQAMLFRTFPPARRARATGLV